MKITHDSPEDIFRTMHSLHGDPVWVEETDNLALLQDWRESTPMDLVAEWTDRRTLSPHHALPPVSGGRSVSGGRVNQPREARRRAFLERWRNGLRLQAFGVLLMGLWMMLALQGAWASPPSFEAANEAYQQGRWEEAARGYRAVIESGVDDADVWYDLGNAYAQMEDLGRARACYERALRLAPRVADTTANLQVLKSKLTDKEPEEDVVPHAARQFTSNELAIGTSVLWFTTALLFALWLRRRHEGAAWLAVLSLGALLLCGGLFAVKMSQQDEAVVIPAEVKLLNGPGRDYTASISLHAGTRVHVIGRDGDWREVGAFNKIRGWVRAEQLESI